ncbi:MAG: glutathione S-transferase family protein [Alphaproteobacteria bacterium]|nr:glutathione S-transferase family protein [Alphaproteobacteria bacterium]
MKLFFTQRSPFARKIRMLARLTDQISDIQEIETTVRDPHAPVLPYNPTGKVPTLVLDNGTALSESLLITTYLEERAGTRALNGTGDQRWAAYAFDAFSTATADNVAWLFREQNMKETDKQSPTFLELERGRAKRNYDALESALGADLGDPIRTAHLMAASLFGFVDAFLGDETWHQNRPKLQAWYQRFQEQPAFQETVPVTS